MILQQNKKTRLVKTSQICHFNNDLTNNKHGSHYFQKYFKIKCKLCRYVDILSVHSSCDSWEKGEHLCECDRDSRTLLNFSRNPPLSPRHFPLPLICLLWDTSPPASGTARMAAIIVSGATACQPTEEVLDERGTAERPG